MRERTILISDPAWHFIQQEAKEAGISAAQLMREASIAYATWLLARRGGNDSSRLAEEIIARLRSEP